MIFRPEPRTAIFKGWLDPKDWEDLKRRAGVTDDRPIILLLVKSALLKEITPKLRRPKWNES